MKVGVKAVEVGEVSRPYNIPVETIYGEIWQELFLSIVILDPASS